MPHGSAVALIACPAASCPCHDKQFIYFELGAGWVQGQGPRCSRSWMLRALCRCPLSWYLSSSITPNSSIDTKNATKNEDAHSPSMMRFLASPARENTVWRGDI